MPKTNQCKTLSDYNAYFKMLDGKIEKIDSDCSAISFPPTDKNQDRFYLKREQGGFFHNIQCNKEGELVIFWKQESGVE